MKTKTIGAARFKAECLALVDEVARTRSELVITKRGTPVARVVPLRVKRKGVGARARILGDLIAPVERPWNP